MLALLLPFAFAAEPTFTWNPEVDAPITIGALGTWALVYTQLESDLHPSGDISTPSGMDAWVPPHLNQGAHRASDVLLYGSIGGSLVAATVGGYRNGEGGSGARARSWMMIESFAVNGLITESLKVAYDRPRPFTALDPQGLDQDTLALYEELMAEGDANKSFPSGHTSMVAALSMTWARQTQLSGATRGQTALAYGVAGALTVGTGTLRVAAGRHHPSDVLAGALLGGTVGWLVPTLHVSERELALSAGLGSVGVQGRF